MPTWNPPWFLWLPSLLYWFQAFNSCHGFRDHGILYKNSTMMIFLNLAFPPLNPSRETSSFRGVKLIELLARRLLRVMRLFFTMQPVSERLHDTKKPVGLKPIQKKTASELIFIKNPTNRLHNGLWLRKIYTVRGWMKCWMLGCMNQTSSSSSSSSDLW